MVGRNLKTGPVKGKKDLMRTFVRRKGGIMKKAHELSVLCGVSVGVVIFGPDKGAPHVWPQCTENLHSIIGRYMSLSPRQRSKSKGAMTLADFNTKDFEFKEEEESDEEEEEESVIVDDEKGEHQQTCLVDDIKIDRLSFEQLVNLVGNLDAKLEMVNSRIESMKRAQQNPTEVGDVLLSNRAPETMDNMQCGELPMPLNFTGHDDLYSGGNCNFMTGDFVGWDAAMIGNVVDCDAGMVGMQEVAQSSWSYPLAPWEEMLL